MGGWGGFLTASLLALSTLLLFIVFPLALREYAEGGKNKHTAWTEEGVRVINFGFEDLFFLG